MINFLTQTFQSEAKSFEYVQTRLRSATDIFKKGGAVTMVYRDQQFRMHFDNKRLIEVPNTVKVVEKEDTSLMKAVLLDSSPLADVSQGENLRFISKLSKLKQFSRYSNFSSGVLKYKSKEDLAINNFLKGLIAEPPMFNLHREGLKTNKAIIDYLLQYDPNIKINENNLKNLKRSTITKKSVPRLQECENFIEFVKIKFNQFDEVNFFRSS